MKQKGNASKKKGKEKALKTPSKTKKITPGILPGLNEYFEKYGFAILIFLLAIISLFVFSDFIFLNKLYLFKDIGSDSINANYTHGYQVAHYIQHEGFIPKWSFYQGMGQNIFPLSIQDPYYFVLMLFGADHLAYGIGIMEIAKIFSAGIFFYLFLRKIGMAAYASIIGSVCYAFSSFIILGGCWNIFSTEAVYIALLLYSYEKFFQDNNIILLPITICLIAINQPLDLFLFGLFLLIYILFRYFSNYTFNYKKLFILLLKVGGLAVLGVLISSFFLFGDILQMIESPRVGGESSYFSRLMAAPILGFESKIHNVTALLRFFSSDIMGTGVEFHGWYNYLEAPLFYFGLVNLLLVPQVFRFLDKRRKIIYLIFISIFLLPVLFPYFRYMFWLFSGDYYRIFGFFTVISLFLCSLQALSQIDREFKVNFLALGLTTVILLIVLFYNYFPGEEVIRSDVRTYVSIFIVCYAILISLLQSKRFQNVSKLLMLAAVCIEAIIFSNLTINDRPVITGEEFKQKTGFNDYSVDAIKYLNEHDHSFFRVTKDYASGPSMHRSMNDAQVQNFFGTPSYYSFNQFNYIRFLEALGTIDGKDETQTRWAPGVAGVPFLHPFASVKYALSKDSNSYLLGFPYDSLTKIGDVKILKARYPLPLGFTYEKYISKADFSKLSNHQKTIILFKSFVFDDSSFTNKIDLPKSNVADTAASYTWTEYGNDITNLKKDSFKIEKFSQNLITGNIHLDKQKLLFFSIPFDAGWKVKVDNKEVKPLMVNIGFIGLLLDKGEHRVELSFVPRYYKVGAIVSVISLILFLILVIIKYIITGKRFSSKKNDIPGENQPEIVK